MYIILVGKNNELNQQIQYYSLKKENSNEWSHSNVFIFFFFAKKEAHHIKKQLQMGGPMRFRVCFARGMMVLRSLKLGAYI